MPTILTNGIQLPDKGSVDWYSSMQSNYNLIDAHLGDTNIHVTTEDKSRWDGKANASHTHTSSELTDIGDFATKSYVDTSINGLVDSAPAALDTLKELSTALGDDANFATTVTTALGNKANSADLATVATSGSYTDLNNKPSIPSKTSDLTNDSNFVDTSNSAVASGITSAKVTSYDGHIADTDIHVTAADKQKWNDGVSQAYVLRYANTAVTPSSTIAYSVLNNTDNIKIGDSLIDASGQVFLIVSVDSVNETITVGAVLLALAPDANVVHVTGAETIAGLKDFTDYITSDGDYIGNEYSANVRTNLLLRANRDTAGKSGAYITRFRQNKAQGSMSSSDLQTLAIDFLENEVRTNNVLSIQGTGWVNDAPTKINIISTISDYTFGNISRPCQINGLNPGALSFPDLSAGLDISSYIDVNTTSEYTPLSNGYISICGTASATNAIAVKDKNFDYAVTGRAMTISSVATTYVLIPVLANHTYEIICSAVTSIVWGKFFPNLGNI